MSISVAEVKLIGDIVNVLQDQILRLEIRITELEKVKPVINNYYTNPPQPIWPPNPTPSWPTPWQSPIWCTTSGKVNE